MEENTAYHPDEERLYANVLLPVKFRGGITYVVPRIYNIQAGSRVKVDFAGKLYGGIVQSLLSEKELQQQILRQAALGEVPVRNIEYKPILEVEPLPPVTANEMVFWKQIADYYLCSTGEVFKAAYPLLTLKQESVKPRKTVRHFLESLAGEKEIAVPALSGAQAEALEQIVQHLEPAAGNRTPETESLLPGNPALSGLPHPHPSRPVLLKGVTGSGKTEIYMNLAKKELEKGRNVLYMVPEIALSKQLYTRLKKVFGERLLTFHSKQTAAEKGRIQRILTYRHPGTDPEQPAAPDRETGERVAQASSERVEKHSLPRPNVLVLGTRSALFLPYQDLGLIIVDEEHDTSYKQTEPAPRYHARDAAIMLANIHKAAIVLGSATPSFESEYNCGIGRFARVELNEKFYGATEPQVEIIDTIRAYKTGQMHGNFSRKLINEIRKTVSSGGQVLLFRNRRSYAPVVECTECGSIPKCPHCNVYLSYHKYNNTLRCHYCDYTARFNGICLSCGLDAVRYKGSGTEKIEEEIKALFPDIPSARYDADIAKSKRTEGQILKDFAEGRIQILTGTQMISKGFDFANLRLVAVMQAETILGIQDFRADEKALQLFSQLMGRTGRRAARGKLIIQTSQREHPVFGQLKYIASGQQVRQEQPGAPLPSTLLAERKEFNFAPYVRMVKITVKHRNPEKLDELCGKIAAAGFPCRELTGPFVPAIDKIRGEFIKCFYVKYTRDNHLARNKAALVKAIENIKGHYAILLDVDPVN